MKFFNFKFFLLIVILLFVVGINSHYEIFALNIPQKQKSVEGCFRVMTYNVNGGAETVKDVDAFKNGLIEEIDKHNPDILCIQELSHTVYVQIKSSLDSLSFVTDSSAILKAPLSCWIFTKKPFKNFRRFKCVTDIDTLGLDSITKAEIKVIKRELPMYSAEIEIDSNNWITVFSCHLRSSAYSTARRSISENKSWVDGLPLYYHNYKVGRIIRNYEALNIKYVLDSLVENSSPFIIAGDFNDWSGSYSLNTIRDGILKDTWWEDGNGFGLTYDAWHLKLRLDHILFSQHFDLNNVYLANSSFSDHYPLISDFKLKSVK